MRLVSGVQASCNARPVQIGRGLATRLLLVYRAEVFWQIDIQGKFAGGHNSWRNTCRKRGVGVGFEALAVEYIWNTKGWCADKSIGAFVLGIGQ